ncbi:N-acetylmuramoyl-L-alanine amidase [Paenibacillus xanthanilyticus]|uniref:N-acetylmuramoyl-L-alanine amidase n=1 Tax=Paenibacillus xanthanilyticus TaxID=1783531 RepID=A0ABV8K5G3_9BACL
MKKRVQTLLAFAAALLFAFACQANGQAAAAAPGKLQIVLNDQQLELPPALKLQVSNNSVMVPIRIIVEKLGFQVDWNKEENKVKIARDDRQIDLTIGSASALVDGDPRPLIAAPVVQASTTLVPLRFVGENMGLTVGWDGKKQRVVLTEPVSPEAPEENPGTPAQPDVGMPPIEGEAGQGSSEVQPPTNGAVGRVQDIRFTDNRLSVSVTGGGVPEVSALTGPDRIVVDLPQTGYADGFSLTQGEFGKQSGAIELPDEPNVSKVRYSLFSESPPKVRIVLDLKAKHDYSVYSEGQGDAKVWTIDLNGTGGSPTPTEPTIPSDPGTPAVPVDPLPTGKRVVVLDAGHGGSDPGTIGYTKTQEKAFTLALALKIERLFQNDPDIQIVMTRTDDSYPTLSERSQLANRLGADLFLSIHANSVKNKPDVSGTESFYYHDNSKAFAEMMHQYLLGATGFKDRKVKKQSFQVLRETTMPAALLEVGFLSNQVEEQIIFTEEFQDRVAQSVADGIRAYAGQLAAGGV